MSGAVHPGQHLHAQRCRSRHPRSQGRSRLQRRTHGRHAPSRSLGASPAPPRGPLQAHGRPIQRRSRRQHRRLKDHHGLLSSIVGGCCDGRCLALSAGRAVPGCACTPRVFHSSSPSPSAGCSHAASHQPLLSRPCAFCRSAGSLHGVPVRL